MAASADRLILLTAFGLGVAMAGCRTVPPETDRDAARSGAVGMQIVPPPPGASHMELPASQRFVFPRQLEPVVLPVYPAQLLADRLERAQVCVEIDIGEDGRVMDARPSPDSTCDIGPVQELFVQASLQTVRLWKFEPAMLCTAPDETVEDACLHPGVVEVPTSVRLSYAFRFSQEDGRPEVEQVGRD